MNLSEEKLRIIQQLALVNDEQLLKEIGAMLNESKDSIVAYDIDGSPLTKNKLISQIEAAESRIDNGHFLTQDEVEKEVRSWL